MVLRILLIAALGFTVGACGVKGNPVPRTALVQ
jgi:predicted small lipoprotein YifL